MDSRGKHLLGAALMLSLLGGTAVWGEEATTATKAAAAVQINVNTANAKTLEALRGIGEVKAKAIVAYREKNGPFKTIEDLQKVLGVTAKDLEQMKGKITVDAAATEEQTASATAAATTMVNINTANAKALEALPGIGETKAKAIVAHREKHGPFKTIEDVKKVSGVTAKDLEQMKGRITVEAAASETSAAGAMAAADTAATAATTKVNLNTANAKALEALPGIGNVKAKAIIAYRDKNGPFTTVDDLKKVDGISAKLTEKLKERVTVGE